MTRAPLSPDYDGVPDLPDHRDDEYHGAAVVAADPNAIKVLGGQP